jgi:protein-arginine kinase activator protein McsA
MATKVCNNCKQELDLSLFYVVKKRNKPVVWHWCKPCCSEKRPKAYQRNWELQKKYGISLEEYELNSSKRENKCDICSEQVKSLHVDHCHTTGKVRGYLCGSCNRALGLFKDSPKVLKQAYQYLQENEIGNSPSDT